MSNEELKVERHYRVIHNDSGRSIRIGPDIDDPNLIEIDCGGDGFGCVYIPREMAEFVSSVLHDVALEMVEAAA